MKNENQQLTKSRKLFSREFLAEIGVNLLILVFAIIALEIVLGKIFPGPRKHLDPLTESRIGGFQN